MNKVEVYHGFYFIIMEDYNMIFSKFNIIIYFISIIYCHIFADFHLQGILASMKQKIWWLNQIEEIEDQAEQKESYNMYKNDYKKALSAHCFEWTLFIHLPILFIIYRYNLDIKINIFLLSFIFNFIIHYMTDNAKANQNIINLVFDQNVHIIQCILTGLFWLKIFNL